MGIFQLGHHHLHYEDIGQGRPIWLIHCFTNSWAPQLAALVHSGYRAILPDLYGHGASAPATALCTMSDHAADMAFSITLAPDLSLSAVFPWAVWSRCRWFWISLTASPASQWRTASHRSRVRR
jgi:hypothetical protein